MPRLDPTKRERCPCCDYPTLGSRASYEICELCAWEDDGQDEARADEVWGGPNHGYSLTQARRNFRQFLVMYEPERDRRIGGPDGEHAVGVKRLLMQAFDRLESTPPSELPTLLSEIDKQERQLYRELKNRIRIHEQAVRRSRET